jgi:hypothetical protein
MGWLMPVVAQDVGMISPLVGPTIDATEYQRYQLEDQLGWPMMSIDSVRLLPRGDNQYLAFAYLSDGSSDAREVSSAELRALKDQIERLGADLLSAWQMLRNRMAQERVVPVFLLTHLGRVIRGEAISMDVYQIKLRRRDTVLTITLEQIEQLTLDEVSSEAVISPKVESKFDPPAPIISRYFFAPTAIPTPEGTSTLQVIGLTSFNYHLGISDKVSVSVGSDISALTSSLLIPGLVVLGGIGSVRYATPVGDRLYLGGGLITTGLWLGIGLNGTNNIGFLGGYGYGIATYGNSEYNLSLGVGWLGAKGFGIIRSDLVVLPPPLISLSGTARVSNRLTLVLENWILPLNLQAPLLGSNPTTLATVMVGGRLHFSDYSINGGFLQLFGFGNGATALLPLPLPYIDFTYLF